MKKLLNEKETTTIQTLANNNFNVSESARDLNYCRNSIVYHIQQIQRKTGLNPLNFFDMVSLLDKLKSEGYELTELKEKWRG